MVGGLPCETLPEFLKQILLHFNSGDVAQAMTAKPRNQVLAQKKRINFARSNLSVGSTPGSKHSATNCENNIVAWGGTALG